jgi:hypothetical protein
MKHIMHVTKKSTVPAKAVILDKGSWNQSGNAWIGPRMGTLGANSMGDIAIGVASIAEKLTPFTVFPNEIR